MEHVNRFIIQCGKAANRDCLFVCSHHLVKSLFVLIIFIWIGLYLVYFITSKLSDYVGRSRKAIS